MHSLSSSDFSTIKVLRYTVEMHVHDPLNSVSNMLTNVHVQHFKV